VALSAILRPVSEKHGRILLGPRTTHLGTKIDLTEDFVLDHTHEVQAGNLTVEHDFNGIYDGTSFQYPGQFGVGWGAMDFSLDEFLTAPQIGDQSMSQ